MSSARAPQNDSRPEWRKTSRKGEEGGDDDRVKRRRRDNKAKNPYNGADTLAVLLQTLVGQRVVIELHDDTQVKGLLEAVSESMTCELSDVSIEPCRYFLASVSTPTSAPSSSSSSNARGLSSTPSSAASSSPSPSASLQLSGTLGPSGRKQQHARGASATAASTTRSSTQTITLLHSPAVVGAGGGDIEQKDVQHCDTHTVLGRAIRYVHIPDALNVSSALDAHGKRLLYLQNRFKAGKRRADPRPERTVTILNNPTFSGVPLEERIPSDKR